MQWSGLWYQLTAFEDIGAFNFWAEKLNLMYKNQVYKSLFFISNNTSFVYEMAFICNRTSYICLESSLAFRAILAPFETKFDICQNLAAEACWQILGVRETRLVNDAVQSAENHFECKIVQCSSLVAQEPGPALCNTSCLSLSINRDMRYSNVVALPVPT